MLDNDLQRASSKHQIPFLQNAVTPCFLCTLSMRRSTTVFQNQPTHEKLVCLIEFSIPFSLETFITNLQKPSPTINYLPSNPSSHLADHSLTETFHGNKSFEPVSAVLIHPSHHQTTLAFGAARRSMTMFKTYLHLPLHIQKKRRAPFPSDHVPCWLSLQ